MTYDKDTNQCIDSLLVTSSGGSKDDMIFEYCGIVLPYIVSSTSTLRIDFNTGLDSDSLGFKAHYLSTGKTSLS